MSECVKQFEALLPQHKCELCISHNPHKSYYEPVQEYIANVDGSWKSDEQKARAFATNEIWEMQWYPDTPVGFNRIFAPTLGELIEFAQNLENT